jgi:hypothetical protein
MKTDDRKYNTGKAKKEYEKLKEKLNPQELCLIADYLAWDKHIMLKTALLISRDMNEAINTAREITEEK